LFHWVGHVAGRLTALAHDPEEIDRELALAGLGGKPQGCASLIRSWSNGGALPPKLEAARTEFLSRAAQGDVPTILRLLDLGFDIRAAKHGRGLRDYLKPCTARFPAQTEARLVPALDGGA
jgi:hypothetical protein